MALRAEYTLHQSEFGTFLYAPIREGGDGSSLSVLSMLARLDIDPWVEAARLAALPREAAAASLAVILSQLPRGEQRSPDDALTAGRLVALLPAHAPVPSAHSGRGDSHAETARDTRLWFILALVASVVVLAANGWFF